LAEDLESSAALERIDRGYSRPTASQRLGTVLAMLCVLVAAQP
jgi:hypothetical protein